MGEGIAAAAPPRLRRGEKELLTEEPAGDRREEGGEHGGLDERTAERIGHRHPTTAHRLDEPGGAGGGAAVELERIALAIDDAAEQDVDRHQSPEGLERGTVVTDREIPPLDQRQAEVAGEIGILEPCGT